MELPNKPDFEQVLRRWEAWWHCQIIDRPVVTVWANDQRANVPWPQKQHATLRERWLDLDYHLDLQEAMWTDRTLAADSLPTYMPNLGPEICASLYGCELEFTPDSSWSRPICHSSREVLDKKLSLKGEYWSWIRKATAASLERGRGKWITAVTDLHTNGDLLASLREPQDLLMEMAEDPDAVEAAMRYLTPDFKTIYDDNVAPILAAGLPVMSWCSCPHLGRNTMVQCDLICMISPALFRRMVLPALQWEVDQLDRAFYHLDGPGALQHMDDILEIRGLHGIQWVYGANNGPAAKWISVYKRIQAKNKCIQVVALDMEDASKIMAELKPQGCWLDVGGSYPRDEVDAFLRDVTRWGEGKK